MALTLQQAESLTREENFQARVQAALYEFATAVFVSPRPSPDPIDGWSAEEVAAVKALIKANYKTPEQFAVTMLRQLVSQPSVQAALANGNPDELSDADLRLALVAGARIIVAVESA